jgi:lysophospholipase L1-like esterase
MKHRFTLFILALLLACMPPASGQRVSDMTAITGAEVALTDVLPLSDLSATTSKKMAIGEFVNVPGFFGSVSATELGYLDGVTSSVQTQINTKAPAANPIFTGTVTIPDAALAIADTSGLQAAITAKSNKRILIIVDGDSLATESYNTAGATANGGSPNPNHWIGLVRQRLAAYADVTVVSAGVPSETSGQIASRIATTLSANPATGYDTAIYAVCGGTNDFVAGTSNATTIANLTTCVDAAEAAGFEGWVIAPKPVAAYATSLTFGAAIRAASFYDGLLDLSGTLCSYGTFDGIHFSVNGSKTMATRFIREVIDGESPRRTVGTEGDFWTVADCVEWHDNRSLDRSQITIAGHNLPDSLTVAYPSGDSAIPIGALPLTVNIPAGAIWGTHNAILEYVDNSSCAYFRVTGAGHWAIFAPSSGAAYNPAWFGSKSPTLVHVDVDYVTIPDIKDMRMIADEGTLLWEARLARITGSASLPVFFANQQLSEIVIRNATIVCSLGSLFGAFNDASNASTTIQNSTIICANGTALRGRVYGDGNPQGIRWIGQNFVSDNTVSGSDTEDVTQGTVTVLANATIGKMGLRLPGYNPVLP